MSVLDAIASANNHGDVQQREKHDDCCEAECARRDDVIDATSRTPRINDAHKNLTD